MARRILSPGDLQLRDAYKLKGWVLKPTQRRRTYFAWCDTVLERLSGWSDREGPSDGAVVLGIASALMSDETFRDHVVHRGGEFLIENENWERLYRVGGGSIYHEYLVAIERHDWPEEVAA